MQEGKVIVSGGLTNRYEKKKSKRQERERYTQLNAEFHRIARREKKASLNEQCQETEENNRMGTTRDNIQEHWRYQGNIHARLGVIKDRNNKDLTEAEEI